MSKVLVNFLVHLLEHLRYQLRYPSFLLSKFASPLKLVQSVVWVGRLGICVTSPILRVLLSGFQCSGLQIRSPRDPVQGFWVSGSQGPCSRVLGVRNLESQGSVSRDSGSQSLRSQVLRVLCSGSRVSEFWASGLRSSFQIIP